MNRNSNYSITQFEAIVAFISLFSHVYTRQLYYCMSLPLFGFLHLHLCRICFGPIIWIFLSKVFFSKQWFVSSQIHCSVRAKVSECYLSLNTSGLLFSLLTESQFAKNHCSLKHFAKHAEKFRFFQHFYNIIIIVVDYYYY